MKTDRTGKLIPLNNGAPWPLGELAVPYWACRDCGTTYPQIAGKIRCNGHDIAPWKDGRGK